MIDEYGVVMGRNDKLLAKTGAFGGKPTKCNFDAHKSYMNRRHIEPRLMG
jgi:hypothetical protein